MKKWMMVLAGIVAIAALGTGAFFYFTAGMVSSADDFFQAVTQKDITKARDYLSETVKTNTDEHALAQFLSQSGILNFKEVHWSSRQISGDKGELEGSVTTVEGAAVPIQMTLVKEENAWKIYRIHQSASGLSATDPAQAVLARAQIRSQQLPLMANDALAGNGDAFKSLEQTRGEIADELQHFKQSGYANQGSANADASGLDAAWAKLTADVSAVLQAQQQVIGAKETADEFVAKLTVLNARMDEAIKILTEKNGSAGQVMIASRQMLLADRMWRRALSIVRGGEEAESATNGLQRDAQYYGALLTGLIDGNPDLNVKALANPQARAILSDMNQQWTTDVVPLVSKLLEAEPAIESARQAADAIRIDSQTFMLKAEPLSRRLHD
jgi:hypothetical protein